MLTIDVIDAREAALALLTARKPGATVCPSEFARRLAATANANVVAADWRSKMPIVHRAIDELMEEGRVQISWKEEILVTRVGPYRIGRGTGD